MDTWAVWIAPVLLGIVLFLLVVEAVVELRLEDLQDRRRRDEETTPRTEDE